MSDEVLSYDEETGEQGWKKVLQTFRNTTERWCDISIEADGSIDKITSTPGHKYYLPENTVNRNPDEKLEHASYEGLSDKWVSACNLKKGDKVLLAESDPLTGKPRYGIVRKVEVRELETAETTYNFEVEEFHTYYVGKQSVCTHNTAPCDLYRGGNKMKVRGRDVDVVDDLVQPTRGISINSDPGAVANFGGANKIGKLPSGLKIKYTGGTHYEIIPEYAMSLEKYQELLLLIQLTPFGG